MKLICKQLGGSHSYGLNTAISDIDYRGVFVNTTVGQIIGLDKHEHQIKQDNESDESYTEFRHALRLLRGANTQMVELLYADDWLILSEEWKLVIKHRQNLVSSEKLFNCLRGYMQGEFKLALGERTGKLGGKRFEQLQKYGYSPKNIVQLVRLAWAGRKYFEKGYFPVNIFKEDKDFAANLLHIKTNPSKYNADFVKEVYAFQEELLINSFENRNFDTKFDEELANHLCLQVYGPMVIDLYNKFYL